MKKILLSIALVLFAGATMAQSTIDLTFSRNNSTAGKDATVAVASTGDLDVTGITSTVACNYNWKAFGANSETFPNGSIICPDMNTKDMTGDAAGVITLTLAGVPDNYEFTAITLKSVALNGSGAFQSDNAKAQHVDFILKQDGTNVAESKDVAIKVNSNGGESVTVNLIPTTPIKAADGTVTLKVNIVNNYTAYGCFYGLFKVSIETTVVTNPEPTFANSYTLTQVTANDLMSKTTATRIAIQNVAFNNHNWLDIKADADNNNSPAEYSEDVVFIWEPVKAGVAGSYRIKDNDGNYLQNDANGNDITLGTIDNAAVFTAVKPEFSYDNASKVFSENEQDKLVRFKKDDGCWINTQQPNQLAKYNAGTGTFTIHFAYELTEVNKFTADFTKAEYASFYAPCSVTIPDGVEAYYLTSEGITSNKASLTKIEGGIIPALTAVILKSNSNEVVDLNATEATSTEDLSANLFKGTVVKRYTQVEGVNGAYVLGIVDEEVGLYKSATTTTTNSNISIYIFLNNANKAYLPADVVPSSAASSASLRFDFGGTTGVEEVEIRNEKEEIYDLTGRRVNEISKAGVYVVNGKKILVK